MNFKSLFTFVILSAPIYGAPLRLNLAQSAEVAKKNSLAAQKLNVEFASKSPQDPCQSGQLACIQGSYAECQDNKWTLSKCGKGSCFAIPDFNTDGTALVCETKEEATLRFTGVTGGVDGKSNAAESPVPSTTLKSQPTVPPSPTLVPASKPEAQDPVEPETITVIVTRTVTPSPRPTAVRRQVVVPIEPIPKTAVIPPSERPSPSGLVTDPSVEPEPLPSLSPSPISPSSAPRSTTVRPTPTAVQATVTVTEVSTVTVTQLIQVVPVTESVASPSVEPSVSQAIPSASVQPSAASSGGTRRSSATPVIVEITVTETATPTGNATPSVIINPDPLSPKAFATTSASILY